MRRHVITMASLRGGLASSVVLIAWLCGPTVPAAETIRLAVQKTGTLAWELAVIKAHDLDTRAGLNVVINELATPEAGKIALRGGAADIIVADWLWVSRERRLGASLVFYPYSSAVGAVMAPPGSSIRTSADLRGKKLAVAGGPIDKSWLLLVGAMRQDGIDLKKEATIVYGAPTLLAEKAVQGEVEANLNFWNFCAALEAKGFRRVVGINDITRKLGAQGNPALLGYVFDATWAVRNAGALHRFLEVTLQAKEMLARSDVEWQRIAPLIRGTDAQTLTIYRERYREGIPRRPLIEEEADARILYRILAQHGGSDLVGGGSELEPGTFYQVSPRNFR